MFFRSVIKYIKQSDIHRSMPIIENSNIGGRLICKLKINFYQKNLLIWHYIPRKLTHMFPSIFKIVIAILEGQEVSQ